MVLDKFNIQWSSSCKATDYLFVGSVAKYTKLWLCGSSVPSSFKSLKSKKKELTVKFHSDASVRKPGFKARFIGMHVHTTIEEFHQYAYHFSHWIKGKITKKKMKTLMPDKFTRFARVFNQVFNFKIIFDKQLQKMQQKTKSKEEKMY